MSREFADLVVLSVVCCAERSAWRRTPWSFQFAATACACSCPSKHCFASISLSCSQSDRVFLFSLRYGIEGSIRLFLEAREGEPEIKNPYTFDEEVLSHNQTLIRFCLFLSHVLWSCALWAEPDAERADARVQNVSATARRHFRAGVQSQTVGVSLASA